MCIENKLQGRTLMMVDPGDGFPGMGGMALDIKLNLALCSGFERSRTNFVLQWRLGVTSDG